MYKHLEYFLVCESSQGLRSRQPLRDFAKSYISVLNK